MKRPEGFERPQRPAEPVARPDRRWPRAVPAPEPHEALDDGGDDLDEGPSLFSIGRRREEAPPASTRRWALRELEVADDDADAAPARQDPDASTTPADGDDALAHGSGSHAQRVDRAWREARRAQRADEREQSRTVRRAARDAKRERKRRERQEVRRFTAARRRQTRIALLTAGGLVAALLLLVGLVWSPLMAVRTVQVEGTQRLDPAVVQGVLADRVGEPIGTVSEVGVAQSLSQIPQLESFRVDVVPPSTIVVRVVERTPVAVADGDGGPVVVDAAGVALWPEDEAAASLPRLSGVAPGSAEFEAVAAMLVAVPRPVLESLATIEAPTPSDIRLSLRESGQTVLWGGSEQSPLKADVVAALIATQDASTARVLDVRAPEHPVVRAG